MQYFPELTQSLPYLLLAAAIIASCTRFREITVPVLGVASVALAYAANIIDLTALPAIATLAVCAAVISQNRSKSNRPIWWLVFVAISALAIAMSMHIMPGFNNLQIVKNIQVTKDAIPYTLYWNFDKGIVGLALLYAVSNAKPDSRQSPFLIVSTVLAVLILITFPIAVKLGAVSWAPKIPEILLVWIVSNLLITCIAEEAFFRGLWQQTAADTLRKYTRHGPVIALVLVSILFGLLHFPGGPVYMGLATIAGLAYGAAYHLTGRLEAAIAVHFLFNLTHLMLFTYPLKAVS
ncbi:MAG: lysostaphin resistance A-like protein [Methyloligellaceae bacterium]